MLPMKDIPEITLFCFPAREKENTANSDVRKPPEFEMQRVETKNVEALRQGRGRGRCQPM